MKQKVVVFNGAMKIAEFCEDSLNLRMEHNGDSGITILSVSSDQRQLAAFVVPMGATGWAVEKA